MELNVEPVHTLLRELSRVGFFEHGLLIGSWPMVVYAKVYGLTYSLRTNDIDFAVVEAARKVMVSRCRSCWGNSAMNR